jgi:prepilin-type processing-associated H-X9-DG protein
MSDHTGGAHVCFADGVVAFLTAEASEVEVRAMLTVAGRKHVRQELRERRVLIW